MALKFSRLQLLGGSDLALTRTVSVKHPTLRDVMEINQGFWSEEFYWSYTSILLSDPYDYMVYLDDHGVDYEAVSPFVVFAMRWNEAQAAHINPRQKAQDDLDTMRQALSFYFGAHDFVFTTIDGTLVLIDGSDPSWIVTEELFNLAVAFVERINCIDRSDKVRPATPSAKRILIDDMRSDMRRKMRRKKKEEHPEILADALATLVAGGIQPTLASDYFSTHIYQILSTSKSVQRRMTVQAVLNGVYGGTMKTDKLSDSDLRWV